MSKTKIRVLSLFTKFPDKVTGGRLIVSTVAKNCPDLSPFMLGPCKLYDSMVAQNMENAWQFSKVYSQHLLPPGRCAGDFYAPGISSAYFKWARQGWADKKAHRYPMGKGKKPEFSLWTDSRRLDYIQARKEIYVPLYAEQVSQTLTYKQLKEMYASGKYGEICLLDYDAYDHRAHGLSLTEVLNNPLKKMGHAFVLMMLLTDSNALSQCALREHFY